jgi:hypothetical protein
MMRAAQAAIVRELISVDKSKRAVELALAGNWSEAAEANRDILADQPDDVEAQNRLGKSLSEIGAIDEAIAAFQQALALSPHNRIARRNLDRLSSQLSSNTGPAKKGAGRKSGTPGTPRATVRAAARAAVREEAGKSGVVPLVNLGKPDVATRMAPGDAVELESTGNVIKAVTGDGVRLGQVEPRLGARISRLMAGGNRYEAALKETDEGDVTLLIREVYQHPSQIGVVSFPISAGPSGQDADKTGSSKAKSSGAGAVSGETNSADLRSMGTIKDWSNDDSEPGDDEVFAAPDVQRIINSSGDPAE